MECYIVTVVQHVGNFVNSTCHPLQRSTIDLLHHIVSDHTPATFMSFLLN